MLVFILAMLLLSCNVDACAKIYISSAIWTTAPLQVQIFALEIHEYYLLILVVVSVTLSVLTRVSIGSIDVDINCRMHINIYQMILVRVSISIHMAVDQNPCCRGPPLCYKLLSRTLCYKPLSRTSV